MDAKSKSFNAAAALLFWKILGEQRRLAKVSHESTLFEPPLLSFYTSIPSVSKLFLWPFAFWCFGCKKKQSYFSISRNFNLAWNFPFKSVTQSKIFMFVIFFSGVKRPIYKSRSLERSASRSLDKVLFCFSFD